MTLSGGRSSTISARSRAGIDLDAKAVELLQARIGKFGHGSAHAAVPCWRSATAGDFILAGDELAAQQLADRRFRDLGDEDIAARPLEAGEPGSAAERVELLGLDRGARRLMKAVTILPQRSSGKPTTATSDTAACSDRQDSISTGETFSPPVMIMSSTRPVTKISPSASKKPVSPVKYQPWRSALASASGRRQ